MDIETLSRLRHALTTRQEIRSRDRVVILERGDLTEALKSIERLRWIIHRYGDRTRMATSSQPHLQQEIDEAMAWAADNPEVEA